jgi:hypothetical protein
MTLRDEPIDRAMLLPVGMALYSGAQAAVPEGMVLIEQSVIEMAIRDMTAMKKHCPVEENIFTNSTIKLLDKILTTHKERTE